MAEQGKFVWNELVTTDPERCKQFYGEVVGWTTADMPMPPGGGEGVYTLWKVGDHQAGGMFRMAGPQFEGIPPHWMAYIAVDDIHAAVAKVEPAGGKVLHEPTNIEGVGLFCVIQDPSGAYVSLMEEAKEG